MKSWSHLPSATEAARAKIESWFGKFMYSFSHETIQAKFEGGSWEARYRVEAETDSAATLLVLHPDRPERLVLHFDEPFFFVRSGNNNFEYFRRIAA